jgi:hypothetical protein
MAISFTRNGKRATSQRRRHYPPRASYLEASVMSRSARRN